MILIINNSNYNIYDLTTEQRNVLQNPSNDPFTLLSKLMVLSDLNSVYLFVGTLTFVLSIIFLLAILVAINEFVPFT